MQANQLFIDIVERISLARTLPLARAGEHVSALIVVADERRDDAMLRHLRRGLCLAEQGVIDGARAAWLSAIAEADRGCWG